MGRGEEDIGVKEEPVNGGVLRGRAVGDGVGIEAEAFDFAASAAVVGRIRGGWKKEIRLALRRGFFGRGGERGGGGGAALPGLPGGEGALVSTAAPLQPWPGDAGGPRI